MGNFNDSLQPNFTLRMTSKIVQKGAPKYFRIHESGDFYNQEYLDKWFEICDNIPMTRFLVYTKSRLDYSSAPNNLVIYWSIWPDSLFADAELPLLAIANFGNPAGVGYQCPGHCDDCLYCFEGRGHVYFKIRK